MPCLSASFPTHWKPLLLFSCRSVQKYFMCIQAHSPTDTHTYKMSMFILKNKRREGYNNQNNKTRRCLGR